MGSLFSKANVQEQSKKRVFSDSSSDSFLNQELEDEVFEDEVFKDEVVNGDIQNQILDYINSLISKFNTKKTNDPPSKRLFSSTSTVDFNSE